MQKSFNSILISAQDQLKMDSNHPMSYVKTRNHFLQNIMGEISLKSNLGSTNLQRNVHVQYLTRAYDKMKQKMVIAQKEKKRYLNPNEYETILDNKQYKQREELERQKQRLERQRNQFYDRFIQNYVEEPEPQQVPQLEILPNTIQPYLSQQDRRRILMKQRQMQLLDNQITSLREQLQFDKQKQIPRDINPYHACTNMSLLQKMSSSILSSYMVHFDQLFGLLIDDILEQEVKYLNSLEGQYKNIHPSPQKTRNLGTDHRRLVELVKTLDDLCDR